jgi:hypothetical protein
LIYLAHIKQIKVLIQMNINPLNFVMMKKRIDLGTL